MNNCLVSFAILLAFAGCSALKPIKDNAIQHVLEPLVPDRVLTAEHPALAVNRASLPTYLDCQQLVTSSNGVLMISQLDLWGEPLDEGLSRVIASNLSRLTGSMNIQPVQSFSTLDYTMLLELKIAQFEPDLTNQMILQGTWKIQPVTGKASSAHFFRILVPFPTAPVTINGRISAMNQALERLARQIVNQL